MASRANLKHEGVKEVGVMALFLSTYINKVDKKGRISVPAQFRSLLVTPSFSGIVAYASFVHECVEACSIERMTRLSESIDRLDTYSEDRDAFATTILGESVQLTFDSEGRVMLPQHLVKFAKITDQAAFVGKGQTFEIWNPEIFQRYAEKARTLAKERRGVLRLEKPSKEGA